MRTLGTTALLLVVTAFSSPAAGQLARPEDVVQIKVALPKTGFNAGETFQAALVLEIMAGYHLNPNRVMDPTLIPTDLLIPEDSPIAFPFVRYPEDQARGGVPVPGFDNNQYHDRVLIRLVGRLPEGAAVGEAKVSMKLRYQTCTDTVCLYPYDKPLELIVPVVAPGTPVKEINQDIFGDPGRSPR